MSEKNDTRKIKNPLFSASVTGATIEDFTQNALLLSAQDIPKSSDSSTHLPVSTNQAQENTESFAGNQAENSSRKLSGTLPVFSSFSSINDNCSDYFNASSIQNTTPATVSSFGISTKPTSLQSTSLFTASAPSIQPQLASNLVDQSIISAATIEPLSTSSTNKSSVFQPSSSFTQPTSYFQSALSSTTLHPQSISSPSTASYLESTSTFSDSYFQPISSFPSLSSQTSSFPPSSNKDNILPSSALYSHPVSSFPTADSQPTSNLQSTSLPFASSLHSTPISYNQPTPSIPAALFHPTSSPVSSYSAVEKSTPSDPSLAQLSSTLTPSVESHTPPGEPVPKNNFPGVTSNAPQPVASHPAGSRNVYRRPGLKRPVYAQIPGLQSYSQSPAPLQSLTPQPDFSSPGLPVPLQPESKTQPLFPVNDTSAPLAIPSETLPYSGDALTHSTNVKSDLVPHLNQNRPSILTPSKSPFLESTTLFSSPVMAAMPIEEVQQTQNEVFSAGATQNNAMQSNIPYNPGYRQVYHHWFYRREIEGKTIWKPFSMADSLKLEHAFTSHDISPDKVVATDGGRYDVNILRRERYPVYWDSAPNEVRRCSWFHKRFSESQFIPYEENVATMLEEEYKTAYESNKWNKKIEVPNGDAIIFHGPDSISSFPPTQPADAWGNSTQTQPKPKVIKRGLDEFDIDEGEPEGIDHVLFLVHGVGSACDLKFRSVEEVVDDFRSIALQLVQSHYRSSCDRGLANRIEVLPVKWHSQLHSEETGIDKKLKSITLESIPRLREFTNDTILDILFYTSPIYCQTIISTVGNELNRLHQLFKERNPAFKGGVSVGGHSLGSLILFDLLSHQHADSDKDGVSPDDADIVPPLKPNPKDRRFNRRISYMMSAAGTGQPQLIYPQLDFQPIACFALGSPIGMFITVRGLNNLGEDFALPTCPAFFNIFHPYDPIAYRIESLINPELGKLKPVLIPHHKGRKRMHLELKETMARVGADLKQKVLDSMKSTFSSLFNLTYFHRQTNVSSLEAEVDKVIENEIASTSNEEIYDESVEQQSSTNLSSGILNNGRRIDYVLQEAPFEFFNEYIFALTSHVCYWESEDTMLLILKEIYGSMGISTDSRIPQQTMTIERPPTGLKPFRTEDEGETNGTSSQPIGMDPTVPMLRNINIGPPPVSGFLKKT